MKTGKPGLDDGDLSFFIAKRSIACGNDQQQQKPNSGFVNCSRKERIVPLHPSLQFFEEIQVNMQITKLSRKGG